MDRQEFIDKMNDMKNGMSEDELQGILKTQRQLGDEFFAEQVEKGVAAPGTRIKFICAEELAELSQCIMKDLRGKIDPVNMLEEMADVSICLRHMQAVYGVTDEELARAIAVKANRIRDNVGKHEEWYGVDIPKIV